MATWRHHVIWDLALSRPDRWALLGSGIRVRFRMASGPEHVVDLPLETARPRRIDEDTYVSGPHKVPDCVGHIEFVLRGAPDSVTYVLRRSLT